MTEPAATILDKICATKREEIAAAKARIGEDELRRRAADAPPPRDFLGALRRKTGDPVRLIAEVKKASPSKGVIRADFEPVAIARTYEQHGASCLSVLTDSQYFQGHLDYLVPIRRSVGLPVLRKDFILDPYQVVEARAAGADAVLLIAECLDDARLAELFQAIRFWNMTALVELYEPANLARVLAIGADLIGINNRDLRTFHTDLAHTLRLRPQVPADRVLVAESGIASAADVARLAAAGVDAMLVGESLMRQADLGAAVDALLAT